MEQPQMNNEQEVERTPVEEGQDVNFDSEGNPRSLQTLPDGTVQLLSQKEYLEARESYEKDMK